MYSPVTQYKMDDHDTYPTIDKLQAYWQQRGKSIEGLAAAVKPTPAAPAPSTEKAADSASGKPASRR